MRRVLQHLADDGPADLGIRGALHLDQGRYRVLVDDQVIDRPAAARSRRLGDPLLAGDENPAAGVVGLDLLPVEQLGVIGDQRLEIILRREGLLLEGFEASVLASRVNPFSHAEPPIRAVPLSPASPDPHALRRG